MLKDFEIQSKLPPLISKCKEDYDCNVNKRIEEVKNLISEYILPEFNMLRQQVDKDIKCLITEAIELQKDAKKEKEKLILTRQKLEDSLVQKQVLYCFDIIAKAVAFLCPVGVVVGPVIEKVASKVDLLALNETEISSKNVPNITSVLQLFENEISRVKSGALNNLNNLLRGVSRQAKRYPEHLKDLLKMAEEIQNRKNSVNEKNQRLLDIKMLEDITKQELIKVKEKLRSQLNDQKSKDALKGMNRLSKLAQFGSLFSDLEIYDESDCSKLDVLVNVIEFAEKKFLIIKQCEENIYDSVAPMMKSMEDIVFSTSTRLESNSQIDLDITNWQVMSSLKKARLQMKRVTEGFEVHDSIVRCFRMLLEATTNLIQVFESIENYREKMTLAAYFADISSIAVQNVSDQNLAKSLKKLETTLKSNLILKHYKTALNTFRQWVFPFSQNYIEDSMLPNNIEFDSNIEKLVSDCVSHIEHMKKNVDVYKTAVMKSDESIRHGEFNSFKVATEPFFVWKNEKYKYLIARLLSGEEIVLQSEVKKSPTDRDAIKCNFIEFHFKCKIKSLQSQLDQLLKGFDLVATHEGNSYYRYANKIYLMSGDKQTISYSFEKNMNGDSVRTNAVYHKLKRGDLMLSPYTLWKLKLIKTVRNSSFDKLTEFKDGIDLELAGHGSYVMNYEPLNLPDEDYRVIEAYNEFDQYLD